MNGTKITIVAMVPCVLMIVLMAFCAGLQVASLSAIAPSARFAVGKGWLIGDVIGCCFGIAMLFFAARSVR